MSNKSKAAFLFFGVIVPLVLCILSMHTLVTESALLVGRRGNNVYVTGWLAQYFGVIPLLLAIASNLHFFWGKLSSEEVGEKLTTIAQVIAIIAVIGVMIGFALTFMRAFGLV